MTNLTIAVDDGVIKRARIRAIQEGTSVSARLREYLAAYAQGETAPVSVPEERAAYKVAQASVAGPAQVPAPPPAWLLAMRQRIEAMGGIEPDEWLPERDRSEGRPAGLES